MKTGTEFICPGCFMEVEHGNTCKLCGYQKGMEQRSSYALSHFTILANRYLLGKQLGAGGFGITYIALDIQSNKRCTIKEFLPLGVAVREHDTSYLYTAYPEQKALFESGKKRFYEEIELLNKLKQIPDVVHITDYFCENNTIYYVMEYIDGINLKKFCDRSGGTLELHQAWEIIEHAGRALQAVHEEGNLCHRDISPENIMMTVRGQTKIIDFGNAQDMSHKRYEEFAIALKPGFAPPEQYSLEKEQGSYTDVYALAATFYYILTGVKLPDAEERLAGTAYKPLWEYKEEFTKGLSQHIDHALELDAKKRIQTMDELLEGIRQNIRPTNKKPNIRGFLLVTGGDKSGSQFIFSLEQHMKIGRSGYSSNIVISEDTRISKVHLELYYLWEQECFVIVDSSVNGTFVQNIRLQKAVPYQIKIGETIVLGEDVCRIRIGVIRDDESFRV